MKADDCGLWTFSAPLTDASLIRCPECDSVFPLAAWTKDWRQVDEYGEEHEMLICPDQQCAHPIDHVHGPVIEVVDQPKGG